MNDAISKAIPYADRQAALQKSAAEREAKRDRKVRDLERAVAAEQKAAAKDIAKLQGAAALETEELAVALAKDSWSKLVPSLARCLSENFSRESCSDLAWLWACAEKQSRELLPVFCNEPQIIARHQLLYAVSQVCMLPDPDGIAPGCEFFLRTGADEFSPNPHYVPGDPLRQMASHERALTGTTASRRWVLPRAPKGA